MSNSKINRDDPKTCGACGCTPPYALLPGRWCRPCWHEAQRLMARKQREEAEANRAHERAMAEAVQRQQRLDAVRGEFAVERDTRSAQENRRSAYVDEDGALRWASNDAVPPQDILDRWAALDLVDARTWARSRDAREADMERTLEQYRKAQQNLTPEQEAEQAYERRAAFGPGAEVVNVLTGRRYRT